MVNHGTVLCLPMFMARTLFLRSSFTFANTMSSINAEADMAYLAHPSVESSNCGAEAPVTCAVRPTRCGESSIVLVFVCGGPGRSVL